MALRLLLSLRRPAYRGVPLLLFDDVDDPERVRLKKGGVKFAKVSSSSFCFLWSLLVEEEEATGDTKFSSNSSPLVSGAVFVTVSRTSSSSTKGTLKVES